MRVILMHPHDPTTRHLGGIGTFINTFIQYAPAGFEIDLVGVTSDPSRHPLGYWQQLKVCGRNYSFLPIVHRSRMERGRIPLSLCFTWALRKYQREIDFRNAILEFHRIEPSLALRHLPNRKVLFLHAHMQDLYNRKSEVGWRRFPGLYFWLERQLISQMRHVYLVREDAVPFYQLRYRRFPERFSFLPTWVDDSVFFSAEEPRRKAWKAELARGNGFDPGTRVLLFVGRFEGQKDPLLLLKAFQRLNGRMGETLLVFIGAGNLERQMRSFVQDRNLSGRVRILAPMRQEEIVRWMNAADCLCLSSAFEGMPRVVVESLQCGLPVVSTDVGETRRLLGSSRAGRLVQGRDPEDFRSAIEDLLQSSPDRDACQRQVSSLHAGKVLESVYRDYQVLSGGGS